MVVAGSMSGALKVWDLEQAKSKTKAAIFITIFLVTVCKSVQTLILIYSNYLGFFLVMRTLTGHTSSIKSLDFHPYGDYCTSGSLDCNVKVSCVLILLINLYDASLLKTSWPIATIFIWSTQRRRRSWIGNFLSFHHREETLLKYCCFPLKSNKTN